MHYSKIISLILLFLPLVARVSAETVPTEDFADPLAFFVVLLFFGACLVLVGIGVVIALACLAAFALFVALGIVSTSALVALVRRRASSGLRALHYQLFALVSAPCGVLVLGFGTSLFHFHLRQRYVLLFGLLAGIGAGVAMAFLFDRIGRLIFHRFLSRNEFASTDTPRS